jgi:MoaA/NifB/PqqE/SkfB family radical SAM enzyme
MGRRRIELIIDLTSRCNIRCIMCYFSTTDELRFKPYDLEPGAGGMLKLAVFRHIASELFPRTHTIGLGCSAEPLLHPDFSEILRSCHQHRVPKTWLQTNLLALTEAKARAIVEHGVHTVAVSIDGTSRETYEGIRAGASWDRLHSRLELLRRAGDAGSRSGPKLRVTFAWMRSNREELSSLPAFAASLGAREIDVRFVVPTVGVDNRDELLDDVEPKELMDELWTVARDATSRGIRLSAYPEITSKPDVKRSLSGKIKHKIWLVKSGIEGTASWHRSFLERLNGCSFPGRMFLIRPNGAVLPCPFWQEDPIALVPRDGHREIAASDRLANISKGLRTGCPVGSCQTCGARKDALFRPLTRMNAGVEDLR